MSSNNDFSTSTLNIPQKSLLIEALQEANSSERYRKLVSIQRETGTLIPKAVFGLLDIDENLEISKAIPGLRVKALQTESMKSIASIWRAVSYRKPLPLLKGGFTLDEAKLYYILKYPDYKIIPYNTSKKDQVAHFAEIGINFRTLREIVENFLTLDPSWDKVLSAATYPSEAARSTVATREAYCGYQDRCVREGTLNFVDPFDGTVLQPVDSCLLFGRSCYLFPGQHPFYLICAGAGAKATCLFIPKFNLIIDLRSGVSKFLSVKLFSHLFALLTVRFDTYRNEYNSVINKKIAESEKPQIVVAMQQAANPAHHIWNFFPGLDRIEIAGHSKKISKVIYGGSEFYGPLSGIFPEFSDVISHGNRSSIIDPHPFSHQNLVLTVGGYYISNRLKERLRKASANLCHNTRSPNKIDDLAKNSFPVVWLGMRKGDKSWINQKSGLSRILNAILDNYQNALFVIDGFLVPNGIDEVSHKWSSIKDELHKLAEEVRSECTSPDRVINLVGKTLGEGVLWAEKTDVYFSPVGSTQHRIGWLSSARGLVYSAPRGDRELKEDLLPGAWESEGAKKPEYIIGTPVESGVRRGAGDRRSHLENVELDTDDVINRLLRLIAASKADKTAPA